MNESTKRLEEKIAYLERHVIEQDKAILELAEELAALRREFKAWRDRATRGGTNEPRSDDESPGERPPHY